jgi:DNA-binding response OmpR family regulator
MKKILLVDDDEHVRKILALGLRLEGFEAIQAKNGAEALELLKDAEVDAITVDLMMPVMDGRAFLQKARGELGLEIPILVITSIDRADASKDLLEGGASAILHKPVLAKGIARKLESLI